MFRFVLSSSVGILLLVGLVVSPLVLWDLLLESRGFCSVVSGHFSRAASLCVPLYGAPPGELRRFVFRGMGVTWVLGSSVVCGPCG